MDHARAFQHRADLPGDPLPLARELAALRSAVGATRYQAALEPIQRYAQAARALNPDADRAREALLHYIRGLARQPGPPPGRAEQ